MRVQSKRNLMNELTEGIPERVGHWVRESAEECRLREQWEACADKLIIFAEIVREVEGNSTRNPEYYNSACKAIEMFKKLKDGN